MCYLGRENENINESKEFISNFSMKFIFIVTQTLIEKRKTHDEPKISYPITCNLKNVEKVLSGSFKQNNGQDI